MDVVVTPPEKVAVVPFNPPVNVPPVKGKSSDECPVTAPMKVGDVMVLAKVAAPPTLNVPPKGCNERIPLLTTPYSSVCNIIVLLTCAAAPVIPKLSPAGFVASLEPNLVIILFVVSVLVYGTTTCKGLIGAVVPIPTLPEKLALVPFNPPVNVPPVKGLSLIHISEPTRLGMIS